MRAGIWCRASSAEIEALKHDWIARLKLPSTSGRSPWPWRSLLSHDQLHRILGMERMCGRSCGGSLEAPDAVHAFSLAHNVEFQPRNRWIAPPLMRSSAIWFLSADREIDRPACKSEYFKMQMFPLGLGTHVSANHFDMGWLEQITNADARFLTGNTMCLCAVGSVFTFVLGSWDLRSEHPWK